VRTHLSGLVNSMSILEDRKSSDSAGLSVGVWREIGASGEVGKIFIILCC